MDNAVTQPTISVVIPSRNRSDELNECLEYLGTEADRSETLVEAIVVDTSIQETSLKLSPHPFLSVRYQYDGNRTFSLIYARNEGLHRARASIVAYIDDDCFVLPGWLDALLEPYKDPNTVATGGRIIYHPWQSVKEGEPVAILDLDHDRVWAEWDRCIPHPVAVPHLPGGNFSVKRHLAIRAGGFDPGFTGSANLEETDFFIRLGHLGGRIIFHPDAVVEHRAAPRSDGIERTHSNYLYRKSAVRNRLYLLRKHARGQAVWFGVRRQIKDLLAGAGMMIMSTMIFVTASVVGIVEGLSSKVVPNAMEERKNYNTTHKWEEMGN